MDAAPRPNVAERVLPLTAQPCSQLPPSARDLLVRASQVAHPTDRRIAIDGAIDTVKALNPQLFHKE